MAGAISAGIAPAHGGEPVFPSHPPLGEGQGIYPGRVVWVYDPAAVKWNGEGYWWTPANFDGKAVSAMIDKGLEALSGESEPAEAWQAIFTWHNERNGQKTGYKPGQKIAVKPNMNGAGEYDDDHAGKTRESYGNAVLLQALLRSLVQDADVNPRDITIYDACRIFPDYMIAMCSEGDLAGVNFRHRDPGGPMDAAADKNAPIHWVGNVSGQPTYLPECVTEADYIINLANLKGHSWGMTFGAKNHFGSFVNDDRLRTPQSAGLHPHIINAKMGDYSPLTDLMARKELGGKTVLWMIDGLIASPGEIMAITGENSRWQMDPFNGGFPASLFFSQDPVAIDSVGADFIVNEPVMVKNNSGLATNHGMENYLHEAAQIPAPPSGSRYPGAARSLGVHEHWNNARDKQYSRNRGGREGIELVRK